MSGLVASINRISIIFMSISLEFCMYRPSVCLAFLLAALVAVRVCSGWKAPPVSSDNSLNIPFDPATGYGIVNGVVVGGSHLVGTGPHSKHAPVTLPIDTPPPHDLPSPFSTHYPNTATPLLYDDRPIVLFHGRLGHFSDNIKYAFLECYKKQFKENSNPYKRRSANDIYYQQNKLHYLCIYASYSVLDTNTVRLHNLYNDSPHYNFDFIQLLEGGVEPQYVVNSYDLNDERILKRIKYVVMDTYNFMLESYIKPHENLMKTRVSDVSSIESFRQYALSNSSSRSLNTILNHAPSTSWLFALYRIPHLSLWHATISIKSVGLSELQKLLTKIDIQRLSASYSGFSAIVTGSPVGSMIFRRHLYSYNDEYVPLGMPKNDVLFKSAPDTFDAINLDSNAYAFLLKNSKSSMKTRIIGYFPTAQYRIDDASASIFTHNIVNLRKFLLFLKETNSIFVLKWHYGFLTAESTTWLMLQQYVGECIFPIESHSDSQPLLKFVDVLITDYSSVWVDYLIFNRPMIYFMFNKIEYDGKDGIMVDDNSFPGPIVTREKSLYRCLLFVFNNEKMNDIWKERRERLMGRVLSPMDGKAAQRLIEYVESHV